MSQIEEIKSKIDILNLVGSYVKLSKTGINYRGICPFHNEKGPSFFVSPTRQLFKCFGCGKGGDIFAFIEEIEGVEFKDALRILAEKAGIILKMENKQVRTERERLYEICELACLFFEKQLEASEWGKKAKEYLQKRGISNESIKKWRIGYSPDSWNSLSDFLVGKGYKREEIIRAGLALQSEKGYDSYDRFRGRIVFPIFDLNSKVVGFGARIFKDSGKKETAKYINTPQTPLYDKSSILYGMHNSKVEARKKNQCILTEGYTDAIMCHQAGFENTVSVSGTALTQKHLHILKRYTENLILSFDMDLAGDNATKRGINMAEAEGFNIKIIERYAGAKDPADIIQENPESWKNLIDQARTIMDYYFDSAFLKFDRKTAQGKREIGNMILPAIKRMKSKIEQSHWISELADKLEVKEESVLEEFKNVTIERHYEISSETTPLEHQAAGEPHHLTLSDRKKLLEEKILSLIFTDVHNLGALTDQDYDLFSEHFRNMIEKIKTKEIDPKIILSESNSHPEYQFINDAIWKEELVGEDQAWPEIQLCIGHLKDLKKREKRTNLTSEIKKAEELGDSKKAESLTKEFHLIS